MSQERMSLSDRLYRGLLRLLPNDFRWQFADEMEYVFKEQRTTLESKKRKFALFRLWWDTAVDIFRTAPREHLTILRQDVRYAVRMLGKNPGQTVVAVMILALGIGANTAIFSVVNSILLRPLPYADGSRLVTVRQQALKAGANDVRFSVQEIKDYREQSRTLADLAEYHSMQFTLLSPNEAQRVRAGVVSANFFDMFGIKPVAGRTFTSADDQQGAPAVLLVSNEFWRQKLNGDPNIVGRTFQMNDRVHTVIGVLPPIPQYPNENDVYMPTSACPFRSSARMIINRDARMMRVFGRLKPAATIHHCESDMAAVATRLSREYPKSYPKQAGFEAVPALLSDELTRNARMMLYILLGAAVFVLMIACANVANLTLARMSRRERELVVRTAMGAGSGRLMRQLLTENLVLALIAAGAGLLFAWGSLDLLIPFTAKLTPRAREISVDASMFVFATLCAVGTSLVFGTIAALYSRQDLASGLKDGNGQSTTGSRRNRMRGLLIASQVAFSYVLLVGAGLMVRTLVNLQNVNPGFIAQRVMAMQVDLNWSKYTTQEHLRDVSNRLLERVSNQPGVLSAAISSSFPFNPDDGGWNQRFQIEGHIKPDGEIPAGSSMHSATVDYFKTLGIPLMDGRTFTESDNERNPQVAVISQSLARHRWRNEDPVGKRITFDDGKTWITIIGIVGDVKEFGLDKDPDDQLYRPMAQVPAPGSVLVRSAGDPAAVARDMRSAVLGVDPQTAIPQTTTLEAARSDIISAPKTTAELLMMFAGLALLIAVTGIGGMLALSVSQRMRELGIRVALGATPGRIVDTVVRRGMALVLIGSVVGLAAAFALTRVFQTFLFHVTPTDPLTFAGVSFLLILAALAACYIPARRAASVDVLRALRCE